MRLNEAKRKYRNQWIAFQYTNREKKLGHVLFHDKDRHMFDAKFLTYKKKLNGAYLTYTGRSPLESFLDKGGGLLLCTR
jgi:hypothetical protein